MSRGMYTVTQVGVSLTAAATTVIEIESSSTTVAKLWRMWIEQETSEASEQNVISLVTKSADGTNVTSPTVTANDSGMAAYGGSVRGMCTTLGTIDATIFRRGFNVLNGFEWFATSPDEAYVFPPAKTFGLHIPVAWTAATISAGMVITIEG